MILNIRNYIIFLALVQLTNGNATSDGQLEILYQGEWYTTCPPRDYYSSSLYSYGSHGDVVCKELGYYSGVVVSDERRQLTFSYQLWYSDLYCDGTEDSIYDCVGRYGYDELRFYCPYIAGYSCQSKHATSYIIIIMLQTIKTVRLIRSSCK